MKNVLLLKIVVILASYTNGYEGGAWMAATYDGPNDSGYFIQGSGYVYSYSELKEE